ncbi:regulatory protein, CxxC_CxxC_SSSS domain-containing, putative [Syntrophotalea carbinolica DSM 2380]|uniref:Regulatory protein, CxxC_CxxC_SSSS domain-containing, putative n=1 Tax=Syntrophotalea carbinolica (strain DSM 2380 / NBRC 103641 / GraBd1) TaxID=338963 RepID=Q3A1I0_SYNC1|nr:zinc ribbon domain-containing protein [Syntrophotalea carbinolica]ABA89777.1 regulatory protein, CxxC_CxxC_SSSS domain-containing, putative [Syntrophotalea carbinolica DSM 2380]
MPIYEYQCDACGLIFEARQKFSDEPLSQCQKCGGSVQKLISQSAFTLKGGGWYQQGYSSSSKPAACSSGSPAASCGGCPKAASNG